MELYNCDCFELMKKMEPESVDIIIVSPPYNLNIKYNSYNDNKPIEEYLLWIKQWGILTKKILKPNGSLFLNMGCKPTNPFLAFDVINQLRDIFILQNTFHWIKAISIDDKSYGHYKPINSSRFVNNTHEYIFHLTHRGDVKLDRLAIGVPYQDASNKNRWGSNNSGIRCRGNCWTIFYKTKQKSEIHPASFPIELPLNCLRLHGNLSKDTVVLDSFLGTGQTGLACQELGIKNFIGVEIDPLYFKIAENNLK